MIQLSDGQISYSDVGQTIGHRSPRMAGVRSRERFIGVVDADFLRWG